MNLAIGILNPNNGSKLPIWYLHSIDELVTKICRLRKETPLLYESQQLYMLIKISFTSAKFQLYSNAREQNQRMLLPLPEIDSIA